MRGVGESEEAGEGKGRREVSGRVRRLGKVRQRMKMKGQSNMNRPTGEGSLFGLMDNVREVADEKKIFFDPMAQSRSF